MTDSRFLYRGRFLGIRECEDWEFASRTNARAVVVLMPVTDQQELVLVEQFRIPVQSPVIELPAGLVGDQDDADESVLTAAARELEEETGFTAGCLAPLLTCPSSAGMSDEMITFVLAEDLVRTGPGGGDASEDIQVHLVPVASASDWLAGQLGRGKQLDPKIYAVLYWLGRRAAGLPLLP